MFHRGDDPAHQAMRRFVTRLRREDPICFDGRYGCLRAWSSSDDRRRRCAVDGGTEKVLDASSCSQELCTDAWPAPTIYGSTPTA